MHEGDAQLLAADDKVAQFPLLTAETNIFTDRVDSAVDPDAHACHKVGDFLVWMGAGILSRLKL
jgi:hypothetical protein